MRTTILTFLIIFPLALCSQNYIADLQKDANAIVRDYEVEFTQADANNGNCKVTFAVTVYNKSGDRYANFQVYEDSFHELKSFSGELFNALGKSLKKIKKSDLTTSGLSSNLATDGHTTFYNLYSPSYPYTVLYVYEMKYKNGILSYPTFAPLHGDGVALEKARYILRTPLDVEVREKTRNIQPEKNTETTAKEKIAYYTFSDIKPIADERYLSEEDVIPVMYLSPEKFCVNKICGDMSSWEKYGLWVAELQKGRTALPQKTIDKVRELTDGISDKREKVKILYNYLQKTTHYISIQLGIGGWQSMPAEEVARTGFGDCKGLSNYMKALLEAADIQSHYAIIRLDDARKRFMPDFPNFSQANHAVLAVPFEKDTVWLECTSQILPFGYIHSDIEGHDALMVGDGFAKFCTLPSNPDTENRETNRVEIALSPEGDAEMQVRMRFENEDFESVYQRMYAMSEKDKTNYLGGMLRVNKPNVSNIEKQETLTEKPSITLSFDVKCGEYAQRTGARLFIPVNPIHTSMRRLQGKTRQYDLLFSSNLNETDSVIIKVPDGYELESGLKAQEFSSNYGSFRTEVSEQEGKIVYIQHTELAAGKFPVAEYAEIKAFYEKIETAQTGKITLKKIEN